MGTNVIPSAPEQSIYPQLPQHDFRMQKANEIAASLKAEVSHYRVVAKKYKRAKKFVNWSATGTGLLSAACSTASFGSALTVIDHFTVVSLVTWPLNGSEAGVDLVLIKTSLLLLCKSSCSYAN